MKSIFRMLAVLSMLCLAGCQSVQCGFTPKVSGTFTLTFITIGKGDAFLMTTSAGEHYLVDTGKREDYPQIARLLRIKGVETRDGIFLTHGHKDHAGSLDLVLSTFPTATLYLSGEDTVTYQEIDAKAIATQHDVTVQGLCCGDELRMGALQILCWLPNKPIETNENNNSVIMQITHGQNSFLMMGDAETEEENAFLNSGVAQKANVLKLGHHGERDASSMRFLKRVQPQYAIITGNEQENPESVNSAIADRLRELDVIPYYSACEGIALDFHSDGSKITVETVDDSDIHATCSLLIREVNREQQRVTIQNTDDAPVDLSDCTLISQRGSEVFLFPESTVLESGESVSVACRNHARAGDLIWDEDDVWKKKEDLALLYDSNFTLLDIHTD